MGNICERRAHSEGKLDVRVIYRVRLRVQVLVDGDKIYDKQKRKRGNQTLTLGR